MRTEIQDWLTENAEKANSGIPDDDGKSWVTKERGDYITRVGMEDDFLLPMLVDRGITDHVTSSGTPGNTIAIGFNPDEQKWYGWSHRAIYGFGVGSTCKKGDCHYQAKDRNDFLEDIVRFWDDEHHIETTGTHVKEGDMEGVRVTWTYTNDVPNEKIRGSISGCFQPYPDAWGKGEWTATTLDEAKEMAVNFAEGVS